MNDIEQFQIVPRASYTRHGQRAVERDGGRVVLDMDLGVARVEGFVVDDRTGNELVAYVMTSGFGQGRTRVCTQADFAVMFRPLEKPVEQPTQPQGEVARIPEKTAGYVSQGNPW